MGEHTRRLWQHPRTDIVVVHLTVADILREGLPFSCCDELIEVESAVDPLAEMADCRTAAQRPALDCLRAVRGATVRSR